MNDRIRKIRNDLSMNQTEFGNEIGATRAMVASYEGGKVVPDKSIRLLICEKFNVNPEWLETGEGVPYREGLLSILAYALRHMPVVASELERRLPRLSHKDLEHINDVVQRFISQE